MGNKVWSEAMDNVYTFLESQEKPQRINKILKVAGVTSGDRIARNYLTKRLRNWAKEGIIERAGRPHRFWYSVTTPKLFTPPELFKPLAKDETKTSAPIPEDKEKFLRHLEKGLGVLMESAYEKGKEDAKSEVKGFFSRIFS